MVCAHMNEADRRGAVDTPQRLAEYCCWFRMEEHVTEFVKQCVHSMDAKAGEGTLCTAPGRAESSTLTTSMLEQVGRWVKMA